MMRFILSLIFSVASASTLMADKLPRVIVLTDAEVDDRCSMVHFLLHANNMQIDGIIQTNSCFQRKGWSHEPWLAEMIDAYGKVYTNLKIHDANYPTPEYLLSRVYVGDENPEHIPSMNYKTILPGAESVIDPTEWEDTPGSDRIVEVLLEEDPRSVFIQCWGGGNTAARAFHKLKTEYPNDYERAISKVVLYCIWYQDAAGPYIEKYHPHATILLNHHFSGSWDYGTMTNTTDFVNRYLHNSENPLGQLYTQPYISEGDTPAFLYSLKNGLRSYENPTYGGWGGKFYKVEGFERVYRDTGFGQLREWIEPAMHDFQTRLQWCVTPEYGKANHHPVIEVPMGLDHTVMAGDTVRLEAIVVQPDSLDVEALWQSRGEMWTQKGRTKEMVLKNPKKFYTPWRSGWYQYPGGTYPGYIDLNMGSEKQAKAWFVAPEVSEPQTIHIILEAYDVDEAPRLTSYARFIITVLPKGENPKGRAYSNEVLKATDSAFFNTDEAHRIGDQLLVWQRNTGGWPKNVDMATPMTDEQTAQVLSDKSRRDDSTTDNNATTMQMSYLARLYKATGDVKYRDAIRKGIDYLLSGQYDNGGWPQFWPNPKGYQSHITYNDNAMVNTMNMLHDIYEGEKPFDSDICDSKQKKLMVKAYEKGVECILASQIVKDGVPTVWCQQHDHISLQPAKARSYELPSFSPQESAAIVRLLMTISNPNEEIKMAVHGAMTWLDKHKIVGLSYSRYTPKGEKIAALVKSNGNESPLWARYYDLQTEDPYFCDRDGKPLKRFYELGDERRNGYAWFGQHPAELYELYNKWAERYDIKNKVNINLNGSGIDGLHTIL